MEYILTALFSLLAALFGQAQAPSAIHGTWTAQFREFRPSASPLDTSPGQANNGSVRVFLELRTTRMPDAGAGETRGGDWSTGQNVWPNELPGLPPSGGERLTAPVARFELRREAGTFTFDGAFRDGRGAGLFTFTPRPEFAAEIKSLGYSAPLTLWRHYQLAVHDIGPRYVRALRAEGYTALTLDEVERGRNHGVTLEYIRALNDHGYRNVAWEDLVRARDHGVTDSFITDLKTAGYSNLSLEQLVRTKDHGVNKSLLDALAAHGFRSAPLDDVIRVKDHGVSAEYIADMKELGFKDLTLAQLVRLRDHGVTPGFVTHARARGFKESTVEELIRLKDRGLWER
jgi:hypothetical protein